MTLRQGDPTDPYREDVYAVEGEALPDGGRRFRRFTDVEAYVDSVLLGLWWERTFPDAPIEIAVERRSRGATFSAAHVDEAGDEGVLWIRDGSWDAVTVVHELSHVASANRTQPVDPTGPHGREFTTALLLAWRELLGVHAYGALRSGFEARGVPFRRERLA